MARGDFSSSRADLRQFRLAMGLAALVTLLTSVAWADPFVLGTSQDEDTLGGRLQRLIYREAFRRLDIPLEVVVLPLQRLSLSSDQGTIDGDVARVHAYADAHPHLLRVDEPIYDSHITLFASNPQLQLDHLADLASKDWRATYLRGVAICENTLKPLLVAGHLLDVESDVQAIRMLAAGRSDVHCTAELAMWTAQLHSDLRDPPRLHEVISIAVAPVYPYLHRKHTELAPRLAATLRQMRAEGLLDRYREQVLRDASLR